MGISRLRIISMSSTLTPNTNNNTNLHVCSRASITCVDFQFYVPGIYDVALAETKGTGRAFCRISVSGCSMAFARNRMHLRATDALCISWRFFALMDGESRGGTWPSPFLPYCRQNFVTRELVGKYLGERSRDATGPGLKSKGCLAHALTLGAISMSSCSVQRHQFTVT